ncbi:tetratricopeptide repeat protein [Flavobacterium procerum]|uniref:Tetratricopeptide repeat protein n=1 Tax=Flavobacterium procerum TaxID=1455569 RepID=A0ABV6BR53_9FLAO
MKAILIFLISIAIVSCKDSHDVLHEEMDKISEEFRKFDIMLVELYKKSEKDPKKVITIVDSLLIENTNETDKYKSQIKTNIERDLHYFKAELLYKTGKYNESINELNLKSNEININKTGTSAIAYVANYIKLKDFKAAKSFLDSVGNSNGNYYALGNYYESIGDKTSALKTYKYNLEEDKSRKHFIYYVWTQKRVDELEKNKPLLNEVFFPTGNPSFEICEVCNIDNEKREKITQLLIKMPENQHWSSTAILESPYDTGKSYYWIRVEVDNKELNYYVDQKTFEIKYFNPKTKTVMPLEDWRKRK